MTSSQAVLEARASEVARGPAHTTSIVCARAQNAELWDLEGRRYIDFAAGIAVLNTGHGHPAVKAAVAQQLERFSHTCFHVTLYPQYVELAQRLNRLVPGAGPRKTLLVSTGAEAVENAVKIARAHTGRSGVIAFSGGFHGRTLLAMALTGKVRPYKAGFGPFPAEVFHAPYPNPWLGVGVEASLEGVQAILREAIDAERVAALIVEPVQGEGGFHVAPPGFLRALRELCDAHGIVLIVDEIQTGFGRTGRVFATQYAGIEPDLMTLAKGIAGGHPLAAVTGKAHIMDAPAPGGLGGTYAGSPVGCAAALAVLDVIERERLAERALAVGEVLMGRLRELQTRARGGAIGDVRGLGAMVAMELVRDGDPRRPDPELTKALIAAAQRNGLILLSCGTRGNVIRILAPLTVERDVLEEGLEILERCLQELGVIE